VKKVKKAVIIGAGIVGQATAKQLTIPYEFHDPPKGLEADYKNADYVFICIPTNATRSIKWQFGLDCMGIHEYLTHEGLETHPFCVIRSTCTPKEVYIGDHTMFWPEFLTERNWEYDAINPTHNILGYGHLTADDRYKDIYEITIHKEEDWTFTDRVTACIAKLATNSFFAQKVHYANLLYRLCETWPEVNYNELKRVMTKDPRMGESHWNVPGPDGEFGFGGKCLPKDSTALGNILKYYNTSTGLFDVVNSENEIHRRAPVNTPLVNSYSGDEVIFARITNERWKKDEYPISHRFFDNGELVTAMESNFRKRGYKTALVPLIDCLNTDKQFNLVIDTMPFTREFVPPETALMENENYFRMLKEFIQSLTPDDPLEPSHVKLEDMINGDRCKLVFVSNEDPNISDAFYTIFTQLMEECNIDITKVVFAFKGGYARNTAWYRLKYGLNIVEYNFFTEVFAFQHQQPTFEKDWDKAKKFLCLNRVYKPFRAELAFRFYTNGMLDEVNLSMLDTGFENNGVQGIDKQLITEKLREQSFDGWFQDYTPELKEEFQKFLNTRLPLTYDVSSRKFGFMDTWQKHIDENMLYIVTESSCTGVLAHPYKRKGRGTFPIKGKFEFKQDISEKIYRPMFMKMPFIHLGDPLVLSRLRVRGFKTFHDFWDESYDDCVNGQERALLVWQLIKKLYKMPRTDFIEMIKEMQPIVEHNYNVVNDLSNNEELYKELFPTKRSKYYVE